MKELEEKCDLFKKQIELNEDIKLMNDYDDEDKKSDS